MINLFITTCLITFMNCDVLICGKYTCDSERGVCIGNSSLICFCKDEFETIPNEPSNLMCDYEKKKQWIAFLLELFGFGIGHFYAGKIGIAIPKLFLYVLGCIAIIVLRIFTRKTDENNPKTLFFAFIACTVCCSIFIWHVVDVILYGLNVYKDGYGFGLMPW